MDSDEQDLDFSNLFKESKQWNSDRVQIYDLSRPSGNAGGLPTFLGLESGDIPKWGINSGDLLIYLGTYTLEGYKDIENNNIIPLCYKETGRVKQISEDRIYNGVQELVEKCFPRCAVNKSVIEIFDTEISSPWSDPNNGFKLEIGKTFELLNVVQTKRLELCLLCRMQEKCIQNFYIKYKCRGSFQVAEDKNGYEIDELGDGETNNYQPQKNRIRFCFENEEFEIGDRIKQTYILAILGSCPEKLTLLPYLEEGDKNFNTIFRTAPIPENTMEKLKELKMKVGFFFETQIVRAENGFFTIQLYQPIYVDVISIMAIQEELAANKSANLLIPFPEETDDIPRKIAEVAQQQPPPLPPRKDIPEGISSSYDERTRPLQRKKPIAPEIKPKPKVRPRRASDGDVPMPRSRKSLDVMRECIAEGNGSEEEGEAEEKSSPYALLHECRGKSPNETFKEQLIEELRREFDNKMQKMQEKYDEEISELRNEIIQLKNNTTKDEFNFSR